MATAGFSTTIGFVSGTLSAGTGVALLHSRGLPAWPGATVTAFGAVSIAAPAHALHRYDAMLREAKDAKHDGVASVSLAPVLKFGDQGGRKTALGAAVSVQF